MLLFIFNFVLLKDLVVFLNDINNIVFCSFGILTLYNNFYILKGRIYLSRFFTFVFDYFVMILVFQFIMKIFSIEPVLVFLPEMLFVFFIFLFLLESIFTNNILPQDKEISNSTFTSLHANGVFSGYFSYGFMLLCLLSGFLQLYMAIIYGYDLGVEIFYFTVDSTTLKIKAVCSFFTTFVLFVSIYFLKYGRLANNEYSFFVAIILLSVWLIISTNSWLILFLSMELQALCFYILMAWQRDNVLAVNTSLKYIVVNLFASMLFLFSIAHFMFFSEGQSFSPTVTILVHTDVSSIMTLYTTSENLLILNNEIDDSLNHFYGFIVPTLFFSIGLLTKLGVAPLSFWLPEVYSGLNVPTLILFSSMPKLAYLFIFLNVFMFNFASFGLYLNNIAFFTGCFYFFLSLAVICAFIGAIGLMQEVKKIFSFLGWSAILNLSLIFFIISLFFLRGSYSDNSFLVNNVFSLQTLMNLCLFYLFYYSIQGLLFLAVFNIIFFNRVKRFVYFFSDLQIFARHNELKGFWYIVSLSFLSFLGLPPLLGFWGKFYVLQILFINYMPTIYTAITFELILCWVCLLFILFMMLVGGYGYIRAFNIIFVETPNNNNNLTIGDNIIVNNVSSSVSNFFIYVCFLAFMIFQVFGFLFGIDFLHFWI